MPNDPLGISFSPFGQQPQQGGQGGQSGAPAPTPQSAIQTLSFRPPRTVGANSPIPGPLLNAPGGAAFGPSGQNLEQLLALLFGRMRGGVGNLPAGPQAFEGADVTTGNPQPLPWEVTGPNPPPTSTIGPPKVRPGIGEPNPAVGLPGGTAGPGPSPSLPWEGPQPFQSDRKL